MYPTRIIIALVLLLGIISAYAQSSDYARISMKVADYENASSWLEVDHAYQRDGQMIMELSARDLDMLSRSGIPYTVLVDNLTAFYQNQNKSLKFRSDNSVCEENDHNKPRNFKLGSMGGFLTLDELKSELDRMHELYPELIKKAEPIADFTTYENRPIWWTGITGKNSAGNKKKNVLYTALHHAREPLSMQQMVYFMWYMLENYASDAMVKKLLDNTQLYFIPCVNPDGYAYNVKVSPDGGGMWRKNRRSLGKDQFGVDLNRNYGYEWGYDNSGSSDEYESDLYRGSSAFSEPETQAVRWFCENHEISSALNYHGFGDYLIYPWGYTTDITSNDGKYKSLGKSLTFEKRIQYGTSRETVHYRTNGDADDWMYGETKTKNRIFAMTPEVGPAEYGFWPPKDKVELLCARELNQNIRMAMAPHGFVLIVPSADPIINSSILKHRFYLYPVTMEEDGIVQSKITPLTDNIVDFQESFYFFGPENNEEYEIDLTLKPGMQDGELVQFIMTLDNGELIVSDTATYIYSDNHGTIDVLSRSADIDNWVRSSQSNNGWGSTTSQYYTEPSSITDSPQGLYSKATENSIISAESYKIPREEEVFLSFKIKWDITYGEDFAQLSLSTDGVHYTPLCGQLTTHNFNYNGDISPVYTGIQNEWLTENISLNNYKGEEVYFKWNMVSRSAEARDGIFVDDMKITFSKTITASNNDLLQWNDHKLYPNPVYGQVIYLELSPDHPSNLVGRYEIRNQLGQLMVHGAPHEGVNSIDIHHFPAGVYLMGLVTFDGVRIEPRKFIVLP